MTRTEVVAAVLAFVLFAALAVIGFGGRSDDGTTPFPVDATPADP